jgi:hypothetical protein
MDTELLEVAVVGLRWLFEVDGVATDVVVLLEETDRPVCKRCGKREEDGWVG